MRRTTISIFISVVLCVLVSSTVFAQSDALELSMSRDWGYGGFGNDIQGLFSMIAKGPDSLARVEFYIDETMIGEVTAPPFRLQFNTDNYDLGQHTLFAIAYTSDGQQLRSNEIVANFVPPQSVGKFLVPILVIVAIAVVASAIGPLVMSRGKHVNLALGAERHYGPGGGGICPKCHRPFALPLFSMNLAFSKLVRCPYCGRWGPVRVQSLARLREAERAELEQVKTAEMVVGETDEEKSKKELENSKYQS